MRILLLAISFLLIHTTCFSAAAYMHVTATGAGDKDGTSWANAFQGISTGEANSMEEDIEASAEAGDVYYVMEGTYTLTSDILTALDGTALAPIYIIGVKSGTTHEGANVVYSDWAAGSARPLFTDGASTYAIDLDDYWVVKNIRMTGSDTFSLAGDIGWVVENCYSSNDGAATRQAFNADASESIVTNCEGISTNGNAVIMGNLTSVSFCYLHDSTNGVYIGGSDGCSILSNIIDEVTIGINADNSCKCNSINFNTIYKSDKAVGSIGIDLGTTCPSWIVTHNIITGFETGANAGELPLNHHWDYNDFYDCTTDRTNISTGNNDMDIDPQFTAAGDGNFDIGSNLDDAGIDHSGDLSTSHYEVGATVYEETAGGGGGGSWGYVN